MKKQLSLIVTLILFVFSFAWTTANAQVYTYNTEQGLLYDVSQFSANSVEDPGVDGEGFAALIDGLQDHCHSGYHEEKCPDEDHWLQVDMGQVETKIIFTFVGRTGGNHDSWDYVDIYGTNTPEDESSWKLVTKLEDMLEGDLSGAQYESPMIDLGEGYQHLRFYVRNTTSQRAESYHNRHYWNLDEFQIYPAFETADEGTILRMLADSVSHLNLNFVAGTYPGYYGQAEVDAFNLAFINAQIAPDESHSQEEYINYQNTLRNTLAAVKASKIPLTEGYYHIVSGYTGFEESQEEEKAMSVNSTHWLTWGSYNPEDPDPLQLFKITAVSDTTYSIQNVASGEFINTVAGTSKHVPMVAEQTTGQMVAPVFNNYTWVISNTENTVPYHTESHSNGAGISGYIVAWGNATVGQSTWKFYPVTDQAIIDKAKTEGAGTINATLLAQTVAEVSKTREIAFEYANLITNAKDNDEGCQIVSNAKSSAEGSYAELIDNSFNTYFHSDYSSNPINVPHFLQIDLLAPQASIFFTYRPRNSGYLDFPTNLKIYVTNDNNIGTDPESLSEEWKEVAHLTSGFPTANSGFYVSPKIEFPEAYRYIRFEVLGTQSGRKNGTTGMYFFTLSEFQVKETTPLEKSEYYHVAGMKDAVDALDALIAQANEKIANKTAAISDTTALYEAARKVAALYIDRDAIDAELAALLDSAQTAYDNAVPSKLPLITNANDDDPNRQTLSNAKAVNANEGVFAHLIDGDLATIFHTSWTAESPAVPHNLQIDLEKAYSTFWIEFIARASGNHDTPNHFIIYGTNDETLGEDPNSDNDSWTKIQEIDDKTIPNTNGYEYTSPLFEPDQAYRYIRMEVIGTTSEPDGRINKETGIPYFNLSEFQVYTGMDPNRVQYNYNPDVKTTADALKEAIAVAEKFGVHDAWPADVVTLRTALKDLLAAYADTTELVNVYNKTKIYANNSYVGEDIGYIDSQDAVNKCLTDIAAARATVDPIQPDKASIATAVVAINNAYDELLGHVNKAEPYKWYYIRSLATNTTYAPNTVIYVDPSKTSTEKNINFGQYDAETGDITYEADMFAMWRLVPIEGTEYYGIQNMGTSHFIGPYVGRSGALLQKAQPQPYRVDYIGRGQVQFVSMIENNTYPDQLHAAQSGMQLVSWPTGYDGASCWEFLPVESEEIAIPIAKNSARIVTLPFDINSEDNLMDLNQDLKTYSIKNLIVDAEANSSTLELTLQPEIKAGEPFVMVMGDYTAYDAENATTEYVYSYLPETVDTVATEANGLVGTLTGLTLNKSGFGYIAADGLKATTSEATTIAGMTGYIDPSKVTAKDGNTDLTMVIEGALLDGIRIISVNKATDMINVYSVDGKLLKKNVKATEANKGLKKGIYVIGKKKVLVK